MLVSPQDAQLARPADAVTRRPAVEYAKGVQEAFGQTALSGMARSHATTADPALRRRSAWPDAPQPPHVRAHFARSACEKGAIVASCALRARLGL
eukprot:scaffold16056_cov132-Isochrysis_galbana.AAC.2